MVLFDDLLKWDQLRLEFENLLAGVQNHLIYANRCASLSWK